MSSPSRRRRLLSALFSALLVLPLIAATDPAPASHEDPPNDPLFADPGLLAPWNWGMQQVRALEAWHTTTGAGVTVAVVDSGVDLDHPDLAGNLVEGRNFVGCENQPDGCGDGDWQNTQPVSDHGTHVAGTIGAIADNGEGVYGVAPNAKLMPVRVLDDDGGTFGEIAAGIDWAVENGADVINMSLGADQGAQVLTTTGLIPEVREAVQRAVAADVVVIAAAGNEPSPLCGTPAWEPGVLCVIATGPAEERTAYSGGALNEQLLDVVAAPGGKIPFCDPDLMVLSTIPPELGEGCSGVPGYGTNAGTSMATPHVAGVAALVRSLGCTQPQTMEILRSTSRQGNTDQRGVYTPVYGWGIVDAEAAVAAATATCEAPDGSAPDATADRASTLEGTPVTIDVLANDTDADGDPLTIVEVTQGGFGTVEIDGDQVTYTPQGVNTGTDRFTYRVSDPDGNTDQAAVTVEVLPIERPAVTIDTPVDGSTVEPGTVAVSGSLVRPASGGTLQLVGDGGSYTTADAPAAFGLSTAGSTDAATQFTSAGPWALGTWDNPNIPTFAGTEPVELSGQSLSLTVWVDHPVVTQGTLSCPVQAQLFTSDGSAFTPNGAVAEVLADAYTGAPIPVTFTIAPRAGAYEALGLQVAVPGVDCGSFPATWHWGAVDVEGALTLADDDLLVHGPAGDAAEIVEVLVDGAHAVTVPADLEGADGSFDAAVELTEGEHTIEATWYDATGSLVGTASSTVTAGDGNTAPDAADDTAQTRRNVAVTIDVLANDTDADGDTLTVVSVDGTEHGQVATDGSRVTYTPRVGFSGTDTFTYAVRDGNGGRDTATVTVTVDRRGGPPPSSGANAGPKDAQAASAGAVTRVVDRFVAGYLRLAASG